MVAGHRCWARLRPERSTRYMQEVVQAGRSPFPLFSAHGRDSEGALHGELQLAMGAAVAGLTGACETMADGWNRFAGARRCSCTSQFDARVSGGGEFGEHAGGLRTGVALRFAAVERVLAELIVVKASVGQEGVGAQLRTAGDGLKAGFTRGAALLACLRRAAALAGAHASAREQGGGSRQGWGTVELALLGPRARFAWKDKAAAVPGHDVAALCCSGSMSVAAGALSPCVAQREPKLGRGVG